MTTAEILLWFSIGALIGFALVEAFFWTQRRRADKFWAQRQKELRDAAYIREVRYGSHKSRKL